MKTTININGEDVEITLTDEQIEAIQKAKEPKEFEFKYEDKFYWIGTYCIDDGGDPKYKPYLNSGRYRKSREVAEQALKLNQRVNRLHALVEQKVGLSDFISGCNNWFVYKKYKKWKSDYTNEAYSPERVYMTKQCAEEICELLNSGRFKLEV